MAASITDAIKKDHREIEEYYDRIISSTTDKEKIQWQNQFTWELARHSIGEELVVYPQFEKLLPDGRTMAEKDRKEHLSVRFLSIIFYSYILISIMHYRSKSNSKHSRIRNPQILSSSPLSRLS